MPQPITQLLQPAGKLIGPQEAELLLSHTLKKPREYIISHPEVKAGFFTSFKYHRLVKKRYKGIPIAYLTGHKEFFGLDFLVNKHTLIPRPETETIVEEVINQLQHLEHLQHFEHLLIDVGTGTGCIPISIIKALAPNPMWFRVKTFGIDISKKALRVAKKNTKKHNVKIKFLYGDLLQPILNKKLLIANCSLIIVANLPYLTKKQFSSEPSIQHEPKSALIAEDNGLALYKQLLTQIQQLRITDYELRVTSYLEIDPSQSQEISAFIKEIMPSAKIEIKKDLAGLDRVVVVTSK